MSPAELAPAAPDPPARPDGEVWLRPNRRGVMFGMIVPAILIVGGGLLALDLVPGLRGAWRWAGAAACLPGGLLLIALALHLRRPRIAYKDGQVLFYLRSGPPVAVPVEHVEAFFVGRSAVALPGSGRRAPESLNLVARISQRAAEWQRGNVAPALGSWSDGYITVRGPWCEPLNDAVVRRLNRRLAEVSGRRKVPSPSGPSGAS